MKIATLLKTKLGWKLFLSHLVVVLVGSAVLAAVAYVHAPRALTHHMAEMEAMMGQLSGMGTDLRESFLSAIGEVLVVGGLAAGGAAIVVSSFVAWRIIGPVRSLTVASRRIAGGDYSHRVEITRNDEVGELGASFNHMAIALDETEKRRSELLGNVTHELRTPLTTIRSMMEGLIDGVLPADTETFLDVQREASRLQRLTSELSELSRAEAGKIPLEARRTDPKELIRSAVNRLRPQFQDKGVALTVEFPEQPPPWIEVDEERILQVLLNLIGNALQYTEPDGKVHVRCDRDGNAVRFSIVDDGIGIPPEELHRVFERFYRVDKSRARSRGGSGIGLTIAAHLVKAHGGTISAESEGVGKGSVFSIVLPAESQM
ncbi:MAG: ATP-binding protein [Spirochaeta sp.]|jgi:signal transduction histidine kinase|nr:ATP-binding protein [Spirochaeta sp.]